MVHYGANCSLFSLDRFLQIEIKGELFLSAFRKFARKVYIFIWLRLDMGMESYGMLEKVPRAGRFYFHVCESKQSEMKFTGQIKSMFYYDALTLFS